MKRAGTLRCFPRSILGELFLFQFFETEHHISQESVNHQQVIFVGRHTVDGQSWLQLSPGVFCLCFSSFLFQEAAKQTTNQQVK